METTKLNQVIAPTFTLLKFTFGILPMVAGLDKFTNLLTHWDAYLSPTIADMLPFSPGAFMMIVGVVEMAAGAIVLLKPAIGGFTLRRKLAARNSSSPTRQKRISSTKWSYANTWNKFYQRTV